MLTRSNTPRTNILSDHRRARKLAMSEVRFAQRIVFSTDDPAVPVTIVYPSPLKPHEIDDVAEMLSLWIKQQRRLSEGKEASHD